MIQISIQTIKHHKQRYDSCGDYFDANGTTHVRVSDMGNEDYEYLVAIHELVELWLCKKRAVAFSEIDAFDMAFEKDRQESDLREPGDDPKAPYRNEHCIATGIERIMCAALGISWADYEAAVNKLSQG